MSKWETTVDFPVVCIAFLSLCIGLVYGFLVQASDAEVNNLQTQHQITLNELEVLEEQFELSLKETRLITEKEFKRGAVHAHQGLVKCGLVKQLTKPAEWQCIDNNGKGY